MSALDGYVDFKGTQHVMNDNEQITPTEQSSWFDEILSIFYALLLVFVVRLFAYDPFFIPSSSMYPTLRIGDMPITRKWDYGYSKYATPFFSSVELPIEGRMLAHDPKRGDIVVFRLPADTRVNYIKRLIGMPGDTIQMRRGRLYINDVMIDRQYVDDYSYTDVGGTMITAKRFKQTLPNGVSFHILEESDTALADNTFEITVPDGHYFMMGDNRDHSQDSRFPSVGAIPYENMIGPASRLMWSYESATSNVLRIWEWPFKINYSRIMMDVTE